MFFFINLPRFTPWKVYRYTPSIPAFTISISAQRFGCDNVLGQNLAVSKLNTYQSQEISRKLKRIFIDLHVAAALIWSKIFEDITKWDSKMW